MSQTQAHVFQAILWDFDGTLVDTEHYWIHAKREFAALHGVAITDELLHELVGCGQKANLEAFQSLGIHVDEQICLEMLSELVLPRFTQEPVQWRPGAREMLSHVKEHNIPQALVTMSPRNVVDAILGESLNHYFDVVVTGDLGLREKPNPDMYLRALELLNVSASDAVACEDSHVGLAAASAAGVTTIAIPYMQEVPSELDCPVWNSLHQKQIHDFTDAHKSFQEKIHDTHTHI